MVESKSEKSTTFEEKLLQIKNPFEESIQSFEKIISWGLAISAGTLLWFAGNFDKFTIKCDQGNVSIPFHLLYFFSLFILSISSLSFGFIQLKLYYAKFKYSSKAENAVTELNAIINEITDADYSLMKNEQLLSYFEDLKSASDRAKTVSENLAASNRYIFSKSNNIISFVGGISYMLGILSLSLYYFEFIYNYR